MRFPTNFEAPTGIETPSWWPWLPILVIFYLFSILITAEHYYKLGYFSRPKPIKCTPLVIEPQVSPDPPRPVKDETPQSYYKLLQDHLAKAKRRRDLSEERTAAYKAELHRVRVECDRAHDEYDRLSHEFDKIDSKHMKEIASVGRIHELVKNASGKRIKSLERKVEETTCENKSLREEARNLKEELKQAKIDKDSTIIAPRFVPEKLSLAKPMDTHSQLQFKPSGIVNVFEYKPAPTPSSPIQPKDARPQSLLGLSTVATVCDYKPASTPSAPVPAVPQKEARLQSILEISTIATVFDYMPEPTTSVSVQQKEARPQSLFDISTVATVFDCKPATPIQQKEARPQYILEISTIATAFDYKPETSEVLAVLQTKANRLKQRKKLLRLARIKFTKTMQQADRAKDKGTKETFRATVAAAGSEKQVKYSKVEHKEIQEETEQPEAVSLPITNAISLPESAQETEAPFAPQVPPDSIATSNSVATIGGPRNISELQLPVPEPKQPCIDIGIGNVPKLTLSPLDGGDNGKSPLVPHDTLPEPRASPFVGLSMPSTSFGAISAFTAGLRAKQSFQERAPQIYPDHSLDSEMLDLEHIESGMANRKDTLNEQQPQTSSMEVDAEESGPIGSSNATQSEPISAQQSLPGTWSDPKEVDMVASGHIAGEIAYANEAGQSTDSQMCNSPENANLSQSVTGRLPDYPPVDWDIIASVVAKVDTTPSLSIPQGEDIDPFENIDPRLRPDAPLLPFQEAQIYDQQQDTVMSTAHSDNSADGHIDPYLLVNSSREVVYKIFQDIQLPPAAGNDDSGERSVEESNTEEAATVPRDQGQESCGPLLDAPITCRYCGARKEEKHVDNCLGACRFCGVTTGEKHAKGCAVGGSDDLDSPSPDEYDDENFDDVYKDD